MKNYFKSKKAITLIALVITIVILIILAGVTISLTLGNNGLFNKAKEAKEKYTNAQTLENSILSSYLNATDVNFIKEMAGSRNNYLDCSITISKHGVLTINGINSLKSFWLIKNNKWVNTYSNTNTCVINEDGSIYVIAIDENANIYKSNTVVHEAVMLALYWEGNKCTEFTNGYTCTKDSRAWCNIDDYQYMQIVSPNDDYRGISLSTNQAIDLTNYNKLKMTITQTDSSTNSSQGFVFGVSTSKISTVYGFNGIDSNLRQRTESRDYDEENVEFNISNLTGNYYIGAISDIANVKIHKIWLE